MFTKSFATATLLSCLHYTYIISEISEGTEGGITEELWRSMTDEKGAINDKDEVYRLVYYNGVQHEIRKEVWPYLLGYYE